MCVSRALPLFCSLKYKIQEFLKVNWSYKHFSLGVWSRQPAQPNVSHHVPEHRGALVSYFTVCVNNDLVSHSQTCLHLVLACQCWRKVGLNPLLFWYREGGSNCLTVAVAPMATCWHHHCQSELDVVKGKARSMACDWTMITSHTTSHSPALLQVPHNYRVLKSL